MLNNEVSIEYSRSKVLNDTKIVNLKVESSVMMRILNEEKLALNKLSIGYLIGFLREKKEITVNNNYLLPYKINDNKMNLNIGVFDKIKKNNHHINLKGNKMGYYIICDNYEYLDKQTIFNLLNFDNKLQVSFIIVLSRLSLQNGDDFPFKAFLLSNKINEIFYKTSINSNFSVNLEDLSLNLKCMEDILVPINITPVVNPLIKKFINSFNNISQNNSNLYNEYEDNINKNNHNNSKIDLINENLSNIINSCLNKKTFNINNNVDNYLDNIFNKIKINKINN